MSKVVKTIEICFENLEYVNIPIEHFGIANLEGITESITNAACNVTLKHYSAETVRLKIMNTFQCDYKESN